MKFGGIESRDKRSNGGFRGIKSQNDNRRKLKSLRIVVEREDDDDGSQKREEERDAGKRHS